MMSLPTLAESLALFTPKSIALGEWIPVISAPTVASEETFQFIFIWRGRERREILLAFVITGARCSWRGVKRQRHMRETILGFCYRASRQSG